MIPSRSRFDYAIAIPARNEQERIGACLAACHAAMKRCRLSGTVVLLVNNTSDATVRHARAFAMASGMTLETINIALAPPEAHAGAARRAALMAARRRTGADGYLLTTDADSQPTENWVIESLRPLRDRRADIVCGAVDLDKDEFANLPAEIVHKEQVETEYRAIARRIRYLLDPDPINPRPAHGEESGASLAMTAMAHDQVGGVPSLPCGEDRGLVRAFRIHDLRVLYSSTARVVTSCRLNGRAAHGMAETIAGRIAGRAYVCDETVEPATTILARANIKSALRAALGDSVACASIFAKANVPPPPAPLTGFGQIWNYLETNSPHLSRKPLLWDEMARELPRLRMLHDQLSSCSARAEAA